MSDARYERYKDALRRGHVAAQGSRPDVALDAYREAVTLAPDRAMPLVSIGSVFVRLGRTEEAFAAYDAALERAPKDEAALRGRIELLVGAGDRVGAAETLDRLAGVLDVSGRADAALELVARALDLAESRSRRSTLLTMIERLAAVGVDDPTRTALTRARDLLRERVEGAPDEAPEAQRPVAPPFDPVAATAAVEVAASSGDAVVTRDLALAAAEGHRAGGRFHAAIDACYLALATNPADPDLHLTLADLYLDRGWWSAAADKLVLVARLVELTDDGTSRERLCAIVSRRLPDEPRLASLCA